MFYEFIVNIEIFTTSLNVSGVPLRLSEHEDFFPPNLDPSSPFSTSLPRTQ